MYQYVPRKGILVKKIKKKRKEKGFNLEKTEQQYSMYTYLSKVRRSSFDYAYFFDLYISQKVKLNVDSNPINTLSNRFNFLTSTTLNYYTP